MKIGMCLLQILTMLQTLRARPRQKINYLKRLSESTLCLFPNVVKAYNSNKIYKELPDMKEKQIADFCEEDEDEFANMIYQEHEQYLILKGVLNKTNEEDITDLQNPFW